jgi:hypothetical protein
MTSCTSVIFSTRSRFTSNSWRKSGDRAAKPAAQERAYLVKANVGITVLLDRRKATRHFRCVLLQFFLNEPVLRRVHRVVDKCPRRNL